MHSSGGSRREIANVYLELEQGRDEECVPRMLRSAPLSAAWCAADPGSIFALRIAMGPGSAEQREERCTASRTRDDGSTTELSLAL
jgi:hypothetical protein